MLLRYINCTGSSLKVQEEEKKNIYYLTKNLLDTYGSMLTGVASPTTVRTGGVTSELSARKRKNCSDSSSPHLRYILHTASKSSWSYRSLKKGTQVLKEFKMTKNLPSSHHRHLSNNYLLSPQFKTMTIYYRGTDFSIPNNVSRGCC